VLLYTLYRATRPPNARVASLIVYLILTLGGLKRGMGGDWPEVVEPLSVMPAILAVLIFGAEGRYLGPVPEQERWRTFHQFSVLWVLLAVLWATIAGASAWLPIGTAASAIVSRVIAAWLQQGHEHRAVRE
jgi:hypothetical protein